MEETKIINLSKFDVHIKTSLTWGQTEKLKTFMLSGYKFENGAFKEIDPDIMLESKYKLFQFLIQKIVEKENNKEIKYSDDWAFNLPNEDGTKLYDELNEITSKKKDQK